MSLSNNYRPKRFEEYVGQGKGEGGAVDYIRSCISKNKHPSAMLIVGSPGAGKTNLSQLYSRATLCENRAEKEDDACGYCDICTGKDTRNITEYTVSQATDFKESVESIKEIINATPVGIPKDDREDKYRRFVIIDEIQFASKQAISALLNPLEFPPPSTTIIIISMDLEKLDPVVREALTRRCVEVALSRFYPELISENLVSKVKDLNINAAQAIANFSYGNMGKAWQLLEGFNHLDVKSITESIVYERLGGGATKEKRREMWLAIENNNFKLLKQLVSEWERRVNPEVIVNMFIDDILDQDSLSIAAIEALSSLSFWNSTSPHPPVLGVLATFLNKQIINTLDDSLSNINAKTSLPLIEDEKFEDIKELVHSKIDIQLHNLINKNKPEYKFKLAKTFSQLISIYE